jgi:hypothetical protein
MMTFADIVLGYAQRLASFLCEWPDEGWLGSDLEWETMKKQTPLPPMGLDSAQVKLIRRATSFGAAAGRPQTDPSSAQWCRDRLKRLAGSAKRHGMAGLLERCFDIGYRTASASQDTLAAKPNATGQNSCSSSVTAARARSSAP